MKMNAYDLSCGKVQTERIKQLENLLEEQAEMLNILELFLKDSICFCDTGTNNCRKHKTFSDIKKLKTKKGFK